MIPNEEREGDGVNTRSLTSNRISSLYPSDVDWLAILLSGDVSVLYHDDGKPWIERVWMMRVEVVMTEE
jgi:hypothetical protein